MGISVGVITYLLLLWGLGSNFDNFPKFWCEGNFSNDSELLKIFILSFSFPHNLKINWFLLITNSFREIFQFPFRSSFSFYFYYMSFAFFCFCFSCFFFLHQGFQIKTKQNKKIRITVFILQLSWVIIVHSWYLECDI